MMIKINSKEKFHAITLPGPEISATMTGELENYLLSFLQNDACLPERQVKNIVLILKEIQSLDDAVANKLVHIQQKYYDNKASFVICELQDPVEKIFDNAGLLDIMNVTPTESEAGDIVQMEEIEREMLGDEEF